MNWKRRWSVIGVLSLAQVGIVICYQGFLKGSSAPANPPAEQKVVAEGPSAPPPPPSVMPLAEKGLPVSPDFEKVPEERLKPMPVDPKAPQPNGWARAGGQELMVVQAGTPPLPGVASPVGTPAAEPKGPPAIVPGAAPAPSPPPQPAPQSAPPGLLPANQGSTTPPPPTAAPQTQEPPLTELTTCPWVLRVEIVKGRTLMTAQSGKDVQFRVSCDKLELQAPRGSILAAGNVSVSSEGLQGSC